MRRRRKVVLIVLVATAIQFGGIFFTIRMFPHAREWLRYRKLPLHRAVLKGNVQKAKKLLVKGIDPNLKDYRELTTLHWAVWKEQAEIVRLLLDFKADVDAVDTYNQTPLHLAAQAEKESVDLLTILLDHGADLDARTIYCQTPLHLAVTTGKRKAAELLLKRGARIEAKDERGNTPLYYSVYYNQPGIVRYLLESGANVDEYSKDYSTPLQAAITNKRRVMVRGLLDHGADVQRFPHNLYSPLYLAAFSGDGEIVKLLVEYGAQIDQRNREGVTELFLSAFGENPEMLKTFLRLGADVNAMNGWGSSTPLHACARMDFVEGARILIEHGANVNAQDTDGMTPLHYACVSGKKEMIDLLKSHEADGNLKNTWGLTPTDFSKVCNKEKKWEPFDSSEDTGTFDSRAIVYLVNLVNSRGRHRCYSYATAFAVGNGTFLLTAAHCIDEIIEKSDEGYFVNPVVISSYYGDVFEVEIVARDEESDLAVLKAPWKEHPALALSSPEEVENARELVFASYSRKESREAIISREFGRREIDDHAPEPSKEGGEFSREIFAGQGTVLRIDPEGKKDAVSIAVPLFFAHGHSGSPMIVPESGKVAGVFTNHIFYTMKDEKFIHILEGCSIHSILSLIEEKNLTSDFEDIAGNPSSTPDAQIGFTKALNWLETFRKKEGDMRFARAKEFQRQRRNSIQANLFSGWRAYEEYRYNPLRKELRDLAGESFKKAVDLEPESLSAHMSYGYFLKEEERYAEAAGEFQKAVMLDPDNIFANMNFIFSLKQRDPDKAEAVCRDLLGRNPSEDQYWFGLSLILREKEKYEASMYSIQNAIDLRRRPFNTDPYYLARVMADLGYPEEGERYLIEAFDKFRYSYDYWETYCYFLAHYFPERREDLLDAMDMAESLYDPEWVYPDELDDLRYEVTRLLWGINARPE